MHASINPAGTVTNIVVADATVAAEMGLTVVPDHVGIGWTTTAGSWAPPPPPAAPPSRCATIINAATTLDELKAALIELLP